MSTTHNIPLLTVGETAALLSASKEKTYRLVREGALPAHRIGGSIRIDRDELAQFIAASPASRENAHG
jgi:excisionase family DNA binding protein